MTSSSNPVSEIRTDLELAQKQAPLVRHMAAQDIRVRYARTILGPFWITITLGLYIMALGFVFGGLFNTPLQTMLPWITLGLITFSFIANIVMEASTILINNKHLLLQTRMSFTVWVLFVTLRNLLVGAHHLVVFVLLVLLFRLEVSFTWLLIIPGIAIMTAFAFGLALLAAILSTRFRDVPPLIVNIYTIGLLAVPVLWRPADLQRYRGIADYNPVTYVMALVRDPLLGQVPDQTAYIIAIASAVVALALGFIALAFTRRRIMLWL
jgi:ABC-type polysaccharide/polyol phosphate export permease